MNLPPRLRSCLSLHFSPGWRRLAQPFTLPELDRAHRMLRARPTDGERPSPIIIHFQQRKLVLMITRKEGQLIYQGHRFLSFLIWAMLLLIRGALSIRSSQGSFREAWRFPFGIPLSFASLASRGSSDSTLQRMLRSFSTCSTSLWEPVSYSVQ